MRKKPAERQRLAIWDRIANTNLWLCEKPLAQFFFQSALELHNWQNNDLRNVWKASPLSWHTQLMQPIWLPKCYIVSFVFHVHNCRYKYERASILHTPFFAWIALFLFLHSSFLTGVNLSQKTTKALWNINSIGKEAYDEFVAILTKLETLKGMLLVRWVIFKVKANVEENVEHRSCLFPYIFVFPRTIWY